MGEHVPIRLRPLSRRVDGTTSNGKFHMARLTSERFGRYEVLAELGRGAMGVVYKARDPKINRTVAIKTISMAGQAAEEEREYRERFYREAEAAGRISHPGIVTIFDVGEEPETHEPYIVMEYVGGRSLDRLLTEEARKVRLGTALQLARELAEALDCAHSQGVVHRDLKPANILITEDGHAKIADFGVAKLNLANHTLAGRALGTPAYMSPEQLNGEAVDGRSDLFSLGVILYTMATGHRPFQGNSALTVSFKVVNREPIPATVLETNLPEGFDYIVDKAMAKDAAQRYQRGMEMAFDLEDLREGREPRSRARERSAPVTIATEHPTPEVEPGGGSSQGKPAPKRQFEFIREHAFVATLVLGLAVVAWGVSHSFGHKTTAMQSQAQSDLGQGPTVGEAAAIKPLDPTPIEPASQPAVLPTLPPRKSTRETSSGAPRTPPEKKILATRAPAAPPKIKAASLTSTAPAPLLSPATLEIDVEHKFSQATLTLWVDDRVNYTHTLEGTDKKRLGLFHHLEGHEFHALQVPPGKHQIRVEVGGGEAQVDQAATISANLTSGDEQILHVTFDKHAEMILSLENDPSTQPPPKVP
jgi:serine/threonine-protein kinase